MRREKKNRRDKRKTQLRDVRVSKKRAHFETTVTCVQRNCVCVHYSPGASRLQRWVVDGCEKCINFFSRFDQWFSNWGSWLLFQLSYEWLPVWMWLCLLWIERSEVEFEHEWARERRKEVRMKWLGETRKIGGGVNHYLLFLTGSRLSSERVSGLCVATVVMLIVECFVVLLCMSCARTSAAVAASEQ